MHGTQCPGRHILGIQMFTDPREELRTGGTVDHRMTLINHRLNRSENQRRTAVIVELVAQFLYFALVLITLGLGRRVLEPELPNLLTEFKVSALQGNVRLPESGKFILLCVRFFLPRCISGISISGTRRNDVRCFWHGKLGVYQCISVK